MNEEHKRYFIMIIVMVLVTAGILLMIYQADDREKAYKSLVKETVRGMVREECLK
jgi:hypothetical protein